jgi:hypothetical protein
MTFDLFKYLNRFILFNKKGYIKKKKKKNQARVTFSSDKFKTTYQFFKIVANIVQTITNRNSLK